MQQLTLLFGNNIDELRDLGDPETHQAFGLDINVRTLPSPHHAFIELIHSDEADGGEMDLCFYSAMLSEFGDQSEFVGIPVFCHREIPEKNILVNDRSGIEQLSDLSGHRVGLREYGMGMSVWLRGHLKHEYGITPEQIAWRTLRDASASNGETSTVVNPEDLLTRSDGEFNAFVRPPEDANIVGREASSVDALIAELAAGDLDVFLGQSHSALPAGVHPLFANLDGFAEYYKKNQIFPIFHILVLRRRLYEQDPTLASSLFLASVSAQNKWAARLKAESNNRAHVLPYGIAANRETISTFTAYMFEQGLADRQISLDECFIPLELPL